MISDSIKAMAETINAFMASKPNAPKPIAAIILPADAVKKFQINVENLNYTSERSAIWDYVESTIELIVD